MTVWRKAATFDPGRASPITWLVAIARNRAIDRLRASAVSRRMEPIEAADAVSDPAPAAVERVELAQQHQRLAGCLEELEAAPLGRDPGGVPRWRHLRGAGRAHERAARHDEELDSAWPVETESLSRSDERGRHHRPGRRRQAHRRRIRAGRARRRGAARGRATARAGARARIRGGVLGGAARRARRRGGAGDAAAAHLVAHRGRRSRAARRRGRRRVWQSLAFWRGFGIGSATLAAASIAALAYIGLVPTARAPLMATLGGSAASRTSSPRSRRPATA